MKIVLNTLYAEVHNIPARHNPNSDVRVIDKGGLLVLRPESEEDVLRLEDLNWLDGFVRDNCQIDHDVNGLELTTDWDEVASDTDTAVRIYAAE